MASIKDRRVNEGESFLEGKLLIAMPGMLDDRFAQTVIYMCAHSAKGAMGIVINKPIPGLSFCDLMKQLEIETTSALADFPVLYGGPVETGRGFVLHSDDYESPDSTLPVSENISLTATLDILRAIAEAKGPGRRCSRSATPAGGRDRSRPSFRVMAGFIANPIPHSSSPRTRK
jgi:putative transcriptional regulator